jgi:calcineurin-like phosphoesterase family protein
MDVRIDDLNKSKRWFTADLHLGDPRLNLYARDLIAKNSDESDKIIIDNYNNVVGDNDIVYFLGDIVYDVSKIELLNKLKGRKILIKGNYDDKIDNKILYKYFESIYDNLVITINGENVYLNHYPEKCSTEMINICGHIHGLWRVQRNTVNVGVDAWHMMPISEEMIIFYFNAIRKFYDINVFAGELECNLKYEK